MLIFLNICNSVLILLLKLLYCLMSPKCLNEIRKDKLLPKTNWKAVFQRLLEMFDLVNKVHV